MSDCSAQAMEPKQKRVCGTCCRTGTFQCQVPVLYPLGRNRLISVDRCMVPELQSLWLRGIETAGCCCGHFEGPGFVQVFPDHEDAMRELGYEPIAPYEGPDGELLGLGCFEPKTKLEFGGYMDVKSELEERHERLAQVAREMYWAIDVFESRFDAEHEGLFEWVPERGAVTRSVKEQLEALGVSVDD